MSKVFENNIVVARRLTIAEKLTAAQVKQFVEGKLTIEEIAEQLDESVVRANFGVKQRAVELGYVKPMTIDPDDQEDVTKAHGNGDHADWAWLSARLGVTAQRLQKAAKGEHQPKTTTASTRGKQDKGESKSRRSQKSA